MSTLQDQLAVEQTTFAALQSDLEELQEARAGSAAEEAQRQSWIARRLYDLTCVHDRICGLEEAISDSESGAELPAVGLLDSELLKVTQVTWQVMCAYGPRCVDIDIELQRKECSGQRPQFSIKLVPRLHP
jgi:hypothetical protein